AELIQGRHFNVRRPERLGCCLFRERLQYGKGPLRLASGPFPDARQKLLVLVPCAKHGIGTTCLSQQRAGLVAVARRLIEQCAELLEKRHYSCSIATAPSAAQAFPEAARCPKASPNRRSRRVRMPYRRPWGHWMLTASPPGAPKTLGAD